MKNLTLASLVFAATPVFAEQPVTDVLSLPFPLEVDVTCAEEKLQTFIGQAESLTIGRKVIEAMNEHRMAAITVEGQAAESNVGFVTQVQSGVFTSSVSEGVRTAFERAPNNQEAYEAVIGKHTAEALRSYLEACPVRRDL